jgi:aminopeptidase-like protein
MPCHWRLCSRFLLACFLFAIFQFAVNLYAQTIHFNPVVRELVEARLKSYGGNNKQREATLKQMFIDAGCDEQHLSEQVVKGSRLPNIVCVLPGSSDHCIIVGAHFDHVSEGDGVVDNWSGASLLPSLFQAIKVDPRKHTYIFIGFTDEEKGEIGSHFYAQKMTKEEVALTDVMVNMDTLGLGTTEIWSSHTDKRLQALIIHVAKAMNLPLSGADVDRIGSSDSVQFEARKIPSTTIHSLTQETWDKRILHTSKDKLSAIKPDDYYQSYRLISAFLAALDQWPFDGQTAVH